MEHCKLRTIPRMWTISSIILMLFVLKATANPINYVAQTQIVHSSVQPIPIISSGMSRKSIKRTPSWNESESVNPEELGDLFEGDIEVKLDRDGVIQRWLNWYGGVIPYEILGPFNDAEMEMLESAMNSFHEHTCIRFRKKYGYDRDYLSIISTTGTTCSSFVGRQLGKQDLKLAPRCFRTIGTPIHELMHAVGFQHEQRRWDRDSYVTIIFENIRKGKEGNFRKIGKYQQSNFGLEYDYDSLLHYSRRAFSTNGMDTIITKDPTKRTSIGQRYRFSRRDIMRVNRMYNCVGYYRGGGNEIHPSSNLLTLIVGWILAVYMVNYTFI